MRPDQAQRLKELEDLLTEELLLEADPRQWPGAGRPPTAWTQEERGDRHWTKKNAIGTAAVLRVTIDLHDRAAANKSNNPLTQAEREGDLDRQISRAEREAEKLLKRVQEAGAPR